MDDLVGSYNMELDQKTVYIDLNNVGHYTPPEDGNYSIFNQVTVTVTPYNVSACTPNKLTETMIKNGYTFLSLTELYGGKNVFEENSYDYLGTSNFKELLRLIYFTRYQGVLSEESKIEAVKEENLLMRMKLKITSSAYRYVYEFYRAEDRRVAVRLYQADAEGNAKTTPVSDFYLSTFAFKKLVNAYLTVLNGEILDIDESYFEEE